MLKSLGQNAKRKGLGFQHRFIRGGPVSENTRQFRHLCKPAAICFLFVLDSNIPVSGVRNESSYSPN
jgi:hypothetical protein